MGYKHLTREQRYTIEALLQTPMSLREIGEVIGVSTDTVSREIRRNCDRRGYHRYRWQLAQKKYERRMKTRRHYLKFTDEMKRTVRRFIIYGQYSPEQICGRFRLKGEEMVCAETIYRWIWQEKRRGNDELARNLRHRGRRKRRRDSQYIPKGTDFSELTDEMLAEIEWKLNHRPRKSLGYRTPLEYCKQLFNFDF